jgi:hypothetical protein
MTSYSTSLAIAGTGTLPRVQIVEPKDLDVWTHDTASGTIQPGDLVESTGEAQAKSYYSQGGRVKKVTAVASGYVSKRWYGVAMKQVQVLPTDATQSSVGPTEAVNGDIVSGEFVRVVKSGVLAVTVVKPDDAFVPGCLVTYDPTGARSADIDAGVGSWKITTNPNLALAKCVSFKALGTSNGGILYMELLG